MVRYYIFKLPLNNPGWCRELKGDKFNIDDYMPVWTDETQSYPHTPTEILEELFTKFNIDIPEHYAAPSLSVGDIICLQYTGCTEYYVCCGVGWKKVQPVSGGYNA